MIQGFVTTEVGSELSHGCALTQVVFRTPGPSNVILQQPCSETILTQNQAANSAPSAAQKLYNHLERVSTGGDGCISLLALLSEGCVTGREGGPQTSVLVTDNETLRLNMSLF